MLIITIIALLIAGYAWYKKIASEYVLEEPIRGVAEGNVKVHREGDFYRVEIDTGDD